MHPELSDVAPVGVWRSNEISVCGMRWQDCFASQGHTSSGLQPRIGRKRWRDRVPTERFLHLACALTKDVPDIPGTIVVGCMSLDDGVAGRWSCGSADHWKFAQWEEIGLTAAAARVGDGRVEMRREHNEHGTLAVQTNERRVLGLGMMEMVVSNSDDARSRFFVG